MSPTAERPTYQFKKIKDYSTEELTAAIQDAIDHCQSFYPGLDGKLRSTEPLNFWKILNGVDAYFERRRRKEDTRT